jgi:hypothetical protein
MDALPGAVRPPAAVPAFLLLAQLAGMVATGLTRAGLVGAHQLMVRHRQAWPCTSSFAHGINIISRLMLFLPRATVRVQGEMRLNTLYVVLAVASMLISAFYLWYLERYEVRNAFLRRPS